MTDKVAELKSDIMELESLQTHATRSKVKDMLVLEIRKLTSEIMKLEEKRSVETEGAKKLQDAAVAPASRVAQKRYQIKLKNYAWDQTAKFVKFYVTLQKIHTIPAEDVTCNFTVKSLELNVKNLENKDYILTINKLLHNIKPESSSWKVKTDMIIISAMKDDAGNWSHVTEIEKRASDAKTKMPEPDKNADASEGLLSIMRNMYEHGDDEMKRTIAKAWIESPSKLN